MNSISGSTKLYIMSIPLFCPLFDEKNPCSPSEAKVIPKSSPLLLNGAPMLYTAQPKPEMLSMAVVSRSALKMSNPP